MSPRPGQARRHSMQFNTSQNIISKRWFYEADFDGSDHLRLMFDFIVEGESRRNIRCRRKCSVARIYERVRTARKSWHLYVRQSHGVCLTWYRFSTTVPTRLLWLPTRLRTHLRIGTRPRVDREQLATKSWMQIRMLNFRLTRLTVKT